MSRTITVVVPSEEIRQRLEPAPDGVQLRVWDIGDEPFGEPIDLLVLRYFLDPRDLAKLEGMTIAALQAQSLGYDKVAPNLPAGMTYSNAVGVHEASTAELALALILASRRGLAELRDAQVAGTWSHARYVGLAGASVLLVGVGGVGTEIEKRLLPFDATIERVGRTARGEGDERVHGIDELPDLLPAADIVVLAIPLGPETRGLVSSDFLDRMKPGALLVNVSRGAIVDTDALVARVESGAITAALDVTDPEPLPENHPLWHLPGAIVTPHVGGHTGAMAGRVDSMLRRQFTRLLQGLPPEHIVLPARDPD